MPDFTMPELAERRVTEHGVDADPSSLSRILCRHGFTYQKVLMASKCKRADVAEARRIWTTSCQSWTRNMLHRIVFIDETSVNTKMLRLRGRSLKSQRLRANAPFGHWGNQTFIAALLCDGLWSSG